MALATPLTPWRPLQSHRGWQAKNYISQTSLQLGQQIQLWEQKANPGRALSLPLWAALCWSGTKGRGQCPCSAFRGPALCLVHQAGGTEPSTHQPDRELWVCRDLVIRGPWTSTEGPTLLLWQRERQGPYEQGQPGLLPRVVGAAGKQSEEGTAE